MAKGRSEGGVVADGDVQHYPVGWAEVEARCEAAANTLARLPGIPKPGAASVWGMLIPEHADKPRRYPPSARAITEMDETLAWLSWLDAGDAKLVMLRADGRYRWRQIAAIVGKPKATCCRLYAAALVTIAEHLARGYKPPRSRAASKTKDKAIAKPAVPPAASAGSGDAPCASVGVRPSADGLAATNNG
jgi:hypothetical protein